jgi:hypothetical protein
MFSAGRASADMNLSSLPAGPQWSGSVQFSDGQGNSNFVAAGHLSSDNPHVSALLAPAGGLSSSTNTFWSNGQIYHSLAFLTVQGSNGWTGHFNQVPYALQLTLNWPTSGAHPLTGNLVFTGTLNGTAGPGQFQMTNTLTGPTTQTLMLGGHRFDVSIFQDGVGPFPPGGPPAPGHANIFARITVDGVQATPEPSTLVMAFFSLGTLAAARGWKRWRSVPAT